MLVSQPPYLMPNIRPLSPISCLWECSGLFVLPVGILCQPASQLQSRLFPSCQVVFWLQLDSESLIDHLGGVRSPLRPPVNLGSCSAMLKLSKYQIWVLHFVLPNVYWILSGFAFKVLSFNYARLKIELRIRVGCLSRKRTKERETW